MTEILTEVPMGAVTPGEFDDILKRCGLRPDRGETSDAQVRGAERKFWTCFAPMIPVVLLLMLNLPDVYLSSINGIQKLYEDHRPRVTNGADFSEGVFDAYREGGIFTGFERWIEKLGNLHPQDSKPKLAARVALDATGSMLYVAGDVVGLEDLKKVGSILIEEGEGSESPQVKPRTTDDCISTCYTTSQGVYNNCVPYDTHENCLEKADDFREKCIKGCENDFQ